MSPTVLVVRETTSEAPPLPWSSRKVRVLVSDAFTSASVPRPGSEASVRPASVVRESDSTLAPSWSAGTQAFAPSHAAWTSLWMAPTVTTGARGTPRRVLAGGSCDGGAVTLSSFTVRPVPASEPPRLAEVAVLVPSIVVLATVLRLCPTWTPARSRVSRSTSRSTMSPWASAEYAAGSGAAAAGAWVRASKDPGRARATVMAAPLENRPVTGAVVVNACQPPGCVMRCRRSSGVYAMCNGVPQNHPRAVNDPNHAKVTLTASERREPVTRATMSG